jgi:hypothetical protein
MNVDITINATLRQSYTLDSKRNFQDDLGNACDVKGKLAVG